MSTIIKIIYFLLFLILLIQPHVIKGHIYVISPSLAQTLITIMIFGLGFLVYILNEKELNFKDQKLNDSLRYIGLLNRQLPLFKNLSSDLLSKNKSNKQDKRFILRSMLSIIANSVAKTDWAMFRFVDQSAKRTVKEFLFTNEWLGNDYEIERIGNNEIVSGHSSSSDLKKVKEFYIVPASDQESAVRNFLIIPGNKTLTHDNYLTLRIITDQAQLFYKYLFS